MTTSRTWLLIFEHAEIERRYQEPVGAERVLAEHVAAVAALPITEGMGTCAAPIEAPAGCAQAGEAGIPPAAGDWLDELNRRKAP